MNPAESKIAFGVCLSDLDRYANFRFDCMDNMKESFGMFRIGRVDCDYGQFYADAYFEEYAKTCNKLSIPWVGYLYLHFRNDNGKSKIVLPNLNMLDIFDKVSLSLPYIVFLIDFEPTDLTAEYVNTTIQLLKESILSKSDKSFTVCVGFVGKYREFADHSEFDYPLYTEVLLSEDSTSFSVPSNTILCWYYVKSEKSGRASSYFYSMGSIGDELNLQRIRVNLDTVIAIGELADEVYNYRGSK